MSKDYSKLFEEAEKAVSGIKNEKFKEMAFEKLLNHLLKGDRDDDGDEEEEREAEGKISRKGKTRKTRKARKREGGNSKAKTDGPLAWLRELAGEGFFKKPKSSSNIREELETRDHHLKATDLTAPLRIMCNDKALRRKKMSPQEGEKAVLHWVNW
jgi:hypothetical protein